MGEASLFCSAGFAWGHCCLVQFEWRPFSRPHGGSNPQYLQMLLHLEIGSLKKWYDTFVVRPIHCHCTKRFGFRDTREPLEYKSHERVLRRGLCKPVEETTSKQPATPWLRASDPRPVRTWMSVVRIDHSVVLWQVKQTNTVVKHDLNSELTSDLPSLPPSTLALG